MSFDPFVAVIVMYSSVMCGTMAVLFWAFKGAFNPSGRLYLFSEIVRIPTLISLIAMHINPNLRIQITLLSVSTFYLLAEVNFIFSLYSLSRNSKSKNLFTILAAILFLCVAIEPLRPDYPDIQLILYLTMLATLSASAIWICESTDDQGLRNAPFWKMLKYVEGLFLAISVTRIVLLISGIIITPTQSGSQNVILVSAMLTLLIFRSFCYQSIWMTWTSPLAKENRLNRNLLNSFRERDLLFQQLAASNRRIGVSALASSLAHQLSQPLTGAALQAEAVKLKLINHANDIDALQGVQKIVDILGHISGIVRNLRSLFGSQDERVEAIKLQSLCHDIIKLVEFSEKASGTTIQTSGEIHAPVFGNPIQIQQVIINLIDNAIQSTRNVPNKNIEMIFAEQKGRATITVRDHGSGFSPEALESLFNLYRTTKEDGTGIGLWLSQQIIEKHKGRIIAYNHPEGGACVCVELPTMDAMQ